MDFQIKNYNNKIRKIIPKDFNNYSLYETAQAVNEMINFLNYCFHEKNNFFINNFNKSQLRVICDTYNTLKTNIIITGNNTIFDKINSSGIKQLKFILTVNLRNQIYNRIECLTKDGLQICIDLLNHYLQNL